MPDLDFEQIGERGLAGDLLDGVRSFLHRRAQTVLVALRVVDRLAEDVGLGVIHVPAGHALDQLEDRAVVVRIAARRLKLIGDLRERRFGVERLARAIGLIGDAAHQGDIEGQHGSLGEHDHGAARSHRVPDAELVEHVGIGAGDVGHGVMAEHQPLEHRLVDGAADLLLVGADRLEPRTLDRGRNDLGVDGIEIGDARGGVHLLAERHQHEAEREKLVRIVHEENSAKRTHLRRGLPSLAYHGRA